MPLCTRERSLIQRIPHAEDRKDDKTVAQEYPTHTDNAALIR